MLLIAKVSGPFGRFLRKNLLVRLPELGLIKPADKMPEGITALMRVFNEPYTIDLSILSIKDYVDEFVIVDVSNDKYTSNIIQALKDDGLPIKHLRIKRVGLVKESNIALKHVSFKYVLKWDADFVCFDTFKNLINILRLLNPKRYYAISFPVPVFIDSKTIDRIFIQKEHWIITYSTHLCYIKAKRPSIEYLWYPPYYERINLKKFYFAHLAWIKIPPLIISKAYKQKYFEESNRNNVDLMNYALEQAKKDFGIEDITVLANKILDKIKLERGKLYDDTPQLPTFVVDKLRKLGF
ncbi:MAG: glycosyltransferase [Candidatus Methanomethylicaceae archaeon]